MFPTPELPTSYNHLSCQEGASSVTGHLFTPTLLDGTTETAPLWRVTGGQVTAYHAQDFPRSACQWECLS